MSPTFVKASNGFVRETTFSLGMVNNSVVENESGIEITDTTVASGDSASVDAAQPVSNISLALNWSFGVKKKSAWGAMVVVPLLVTAATSFFMGGVRYRYFLYSISSGFNYAQKGITFHIIPKLRFFVGGSLTGGYLIYNTDSAKKTDASFNLGLEGGIMYQWNRKYAIEGSLALIKRTGILTSGMGMNMFLGVGISL
jgi:hypothetical protein